MRILTKYLLLEFIPPFLLSLTSLTFILLLDEVFRLIKLFVRKGISPVYLLQLLAYLFPATVVITVPMATLIGILVSLGRMSTDGETTAMKAHGLSIFRIMTPIIIASAFLSVADLLLMDYALPLGNSAYSSLKSKLAKHNPAFVLEDGTFMRELERKGKIWFYDRLDETGQLQNVKIWDAIWSGKPRFLQAETATLQIKSDGIWLELRNGSTYEAVSDSIDSYRTTHFSENRIALRFNNDSNNSETKSVNPRNMSLQKLKARIAQTSEELRNAPQSKFLTDRLRYALVEYHKKFSIPFACFAFSVVGVPLGLMVRKSGRMVGLGLGLVLILIYYLTLQLGQDLGRDGKLHPLLAMWMPNALLLLNGVALLLRRK